MKNSFARKQTGSTLLVCMVMLLIITLLAVSNSREVTLEERMTSGARDNQAAHNGAESALREAEARLAASPGVPTATNSCNPNTALCVQATVLTDTTLRGWRWADWTGNANSRNYAGSTGNSSLSMLNNTPRWNTAFIGFDPANSLGNVEVTDPELRSKGVGPYYYQVNAASQGTSDRLMIALQTVSVQRY